MALVSVGEAADRLDVSVRQVQRLVRAGKLDAAGIDRIELGSLFQLQGSRQGSHRRAWSEPTAWGCVALLSGEDAAWLGQAQRSRLKGQLTGVAARELPARVRNRASVRAFRAHSMAHDRIRREIVASGAQASVDALIPSQRVDGYISDATYRQLVDRFRLQADWEGEITLRVTTFDIDIVEHVAGAGQVLAAFDLAESSDAREQSAGMKVLAAALEDLGART